MINVNNQFQGNNLKIEFSGEAIETKNIIIPISNDVNFKPVIDYLIGIIPNKENLKSSFEDYSEEEYIEKIGLIKETIQEIYNEFNSSIGDNLDQEDNKSEDDDLPF